MAFSIPDWISEWGKFLFGGVGLLVVGGAGRWILSQRSRPPEAPKYRFSSPTIEDLKAASQILLVDDQKFEYLELLGQNGYQIERRRDVTSIEEIVNRDYAVVLLDLYGIGNRFSSEDHGLGILAALRDRSPAHLVAVYSASRWDVEQSRRYLLLADAVVDKARSGFAEFAGTLDDLLLKTVDVARYTEVIERALPRKLDDEERAALRRVLTEAEPHDLAARMESLERAVPLIAGVDATAHGEVRAVMDYATRRLRPWIKTL